MGGCVFDNIKADIARYDIFGAYKFKYLLFAQEFYAVLIYRFGKYADKTGNPAIRFFLKKVYFVLNKIVSEICAGIYVALESDIGKGLQFGHFGGIYIIGKIGKNCTISQQVVIGYKGGFSGGKCPTLGDNVYVGAGAKIVGGITIGNNAKIGANAVVLDDIPDNATAVGIPAKVVKISSGNNNG